MAEIPRLNGIIRALENKQHALTTFVAPEVEGALAVSSAPYDGIVFECEHNPWDARNLRDCLQYLLNRKQIADAGSVVPAVTPLVRIPPNGCEMSQLFAKQALDLGAYGVMWPHISSVEQARNAVSACRYPRMIDAPRYDPPGIRGDGPTGAIRYWGMSQPEYYKRADVWPLDPNGEILVIIQIEDLEGIANLPRMLKEVPGIGVVVIGEGDLGQELGFPRQYEHPKLLEQMAKVVSICKEHGVPVGHPHVGSDNVERVIADGYEFLMAAPTRSFGALEKARHLTGRTAKA